MWIASLAILVGLTAWIGMAALRPSTAFAQTDEPTSPPAEPAPATVPPIVVPPQVDPPAPTSPPAATDAPVAPTSPPVRPPADDDDDDDPAPPAPSDLEQPTLAPGRPSRTPRPTRTPRTTPTSSPTPATTGGLRMTLVSLPARLVLRESASFLVEVINQSANDAVGITLDIAAPDVLIDYRVESRAGETSRAGPLVRWYIPELASGARTSLRLSGNVARAGSDRTAICVTMLSAAAPLEHCGAFEVLRTRPEGEATESESPAFPLGDPPPAEIASNPIEDLFQAIPPGAWLLVLGVLALGAWWGGQLRAKAEPNDQEPDPDSADATETSKSGGKHGKPESSDKAKAPRKKRGKGYKK